MDAQSNPKTNRFASLSLAEIEMIAAELSALLGARLQDVFQTKTEVGLEFYHNRETLWLWLDLDPLRPMIVRLNSVPPRRQKVARPLTLFLRSRFTGRRLMSVHVDRERGRILILNFHRAPEEEEQGACELEIRLFPHGQNVIARDGDKSVAELKPKEIPVAGLTDTDLPPPRSWSEIEDHWRSQRGLIEKKEEPAKSKETLARDYQKAIEKKEKALERMREELAEKESTELFEVGEWLKINRSLEVPEKWRRWIDPQKPLAWNIENCFQRAKENARKAEGTRERIRQVEAELAALREGGIEGFAKAREAARTQKQALRENLLSQAEARGRRLKIADDLEAYIGKSAADNLALLRRAQPFDYWLHLRDQPGSHAILRRTRGRVVSDDEFRRAGVWVVEQSLGKRAHELKGERFDLLIVECRYVRPIKGDKLGRVHYTNDRVLTLKF